MQNISKKSKGFTLIELLVVVALVAITAGISADIVISLVRSFNKTKVTNEIETVGNLALLKLEKELKTADTVIVDYVNYPELDPSPGTTNNIIAFTREIEDTDFAIAYKVENQNMYRAQAAAYNDIHDNPDLYEPLITATAGGIGIANTDVFSIIESPSPFVIKVKLIYEQFDAGADTSFTGSVELNQTIVVRGTY